MADRRDFVDNDALDAAAGQLDARNHAISEAIDDHGYARKVIDYDSEMRKCLFAKHLKIYLDGNVPIGRAEVLVRCNDEYLASLHQLGENLAHAYRIIDQYEYKCRRADEARTNLVTERAKMGLL